MSGESAGDEGSVADVPAAPEPRRIRGVGAIIFDSAGRLLLIQRGHEPSMGLWSVPGGKVEPGESDEQAVAREVAEETGLSVRVGALAGSLSRPGADGVVYDIYDYDATVVGIAEADTTRDTVDADVAGDEGSVADGDGSGEAPTVGLGQAASDAADLRWVAPAELAGLPLTEGLVDLLRTWGRLD